MKLSQLKSLLYVAESGSLVKAADRLHTVQPAVSRQIRMLEEELKARLFERHGRGMVPTEAGHKAIEGARRIMAELDHIQSDVAEADTTLRGQVTVGMPPALADLLALPLVQAIQASHPKVELQLMSAFTGHLRDWMQRGELDLAIIYEQAHSRALHATPLLRERLYLVGPPGCGLSLKRSVPFAALGGKTFILPPRHHNLPAMVEQAAADKGVTLKILAKIDSLSAIRNLVVQGMGYTVLPLAPVASDVAAGRLSAAPLSGPALSRGLVLAQPSDRRPSRAARFAAGAVIDIVRHLVQTQVLFGRLERAVQSGAPPRLAPPQT